MFMHTAANLRGEYEMEKGVPLDRAPYVFGSDYWLTRLAEEKNNLAVRHAQRSKPASAPFLVNCFEELYLDMPVLSVAQGELESALHKALIDGEELFAIGARVRNEYAEAPQRILPAKWTSLEPDFENNSAHAPGLLIVGIRIYLVGSYPEEAVTAPQGQFSRARLERWYRWYVDDNYQRGHMPSREEDEAAAINALGEGVPRDAVRALRRELAPPEWTRKGRRPGRAKADSAGSSPSDEPE